MTDPATNPDDSPLAEAYRILRDRPRTGEAPACPPDTALLARFCRRLGAVPKTWEDAQAVDAATDLVADAGARFGDAPHDAEAAIAAFCAGPGAVCGDKPRCAECPVAAHCAYPDRLITIKDLPEDQRPRERLLAEGPDRLHDRELLAIILRSGTGKETAVQLADRLLSRYGSLRALARCTAGELQAVSGIGPAKASQIVAAFAIGRRCISEPLPAGTFITGSRQLFEHMREQFRGIKKEHFYVLLLDTKHRIIRRERVSVGSLNESIVHPREVFRNAIRESAAKVIFVHNHPSGNPDPSPQDRRLTARLAEAGDLVGIKVLDHVVVGDESYFSFAEQGLLDASRAS